MRKEYKSTLCWRSCVFSVYRVAKKPRVCGYYPWGRFAKWAVSEEGFTSTRTTECILNTNITKKNNRWWPIPEIIPSFRKKLWFILKIHSDLQFGEPNFTTFWGRFANFENFARRKVQGFLQLYPCTLFCSHRECCGGKLGEAGRW